MTVSATSMKLRFPEFEQYADSLIEFAIEDAASGIDTSPTSPWGTDVNRALSYLAAHHVMVRAQRLESGTGQVIQSERIGEISITYQAQKQLTAADPSDLTTTDYGAYYLTLANRYFAGARII